MSTNRSCRESSTRSRKTVSGRSKAPMQTTNACSSISEIVSLVALHLRPPRHHVKWGWIASSIATRPVNSTWWRISMRKFFASMTIVLAVSATACSKADSKSPLSPSTPTSAAPSGGGVSGSASIAGTVVGGASGASVQPMGSALVVTIVGTSMSATVASSGRFTLQNVPSGDLTLQFTGSGVNARITISGVADREQIRITINVNDNSASVDDNVRETSDNRAQVEGRIVSVTCAANPATLVVGQTSPITVLIPAGTPIRHDGTAVACSQLLVGALVHVKGTKNGSSVTASQIELQNNPGPNPGSNPPPPALTQVEPQGAMSLLARTWPSLTFTASSTKVTTNSATAFNDTTCAGLHNGSVVEVKGTRQTDGSVLATKVEKNDDQNEQDEAEVKGTISSAITGTCPAISFTFGSTSVTTNASTTFNDTTCAALKQGDQVEVKGTRQANGSVLARKVEKDNTDDNENEDKNEAEVKGAISSAITGTCPSIAFSIGSTSVSTAASTRFDDTSCSALKRGDTVEVKGTRQTNGSVLASRVKKKNSHGGRGSARNLRPAVVWPV